MDPGCVRTRAIGAPISVADRGYYEGEEILACETVGITVTLPKPMTSSAKAAGRFDKQDFIYVAADDVYRCPAGERHERGGRQDAAPLLDDGLSGVRAEGSVYA